MFSFIIRQSSRGWGGESLLLPGEKKATENILRKTRETGDVLSL